MFSTLFATQYLVHNCLPLKLFRASLPFTKCSWTVNKSFFFSKNYSWDLPSIWTWRSSSSAAPRRWRGCSSQTASRWSTRAAGRSCNRKRSQLATNRTKDCLPVIHTGCRAQLQQKVLTILRQPIVNRLDMLQGAAITKTHSTLMYNCTYRQ